MACTLTPGVYFGSIECYYRWCKYHDKNEPFCCEDKCRATDSQLKRFAFLRKAEKAMWDADRRYDDGLSNPNG